MQLQSCLVSKSDMSGQNKTLDQEYQARRETYDLFSEFKRQTNVLSVPGNKTSHEGFQFESLLQHHTQRHM